MMAKCPQISLVGLRRSGEGHKPVRPKKAQEEQIRRRLQALYAALYSFPTSGPVGQLPNMMQQRYNLMAEISQLETQLGGTAQPKER